MSNHVKHIETPYEDGDWKITTLVYGVNARRYSYIEHRCNKTPIGTPMKWRQLNYLVSGRGNHCQYCHTAPPEGLQAVFWFLKDDQGTSIANLT